MVFNVGDTASFRRILTQSEFDRFAALSHDDNPIHCDPAFAAKSHFGRTVSHGMLLDSLICKGFAELIPGPGAKQIEQDLMFPHGTFTGEEVFISLTVTKVNPDGTLEVATVITKASDPSIVKAQGKARVAPLGVKPTKFGSPSLSNEAGDDYLYGLRPGMYYESKRTFNAADLKEYCDLTGDRNPIWCDGDFARRDGYADIIVPWPLLAGMFSDMLGTQLPGRGTGWMKQRLIYPDAAYPGEELTARVEITRLRADKELVNLRSTIIAADGRLVCDGESLVLVRNLANKEDKSALFPVAVREQVPLAA